MDPKLTPVIVTTVPTAPELGDKVVKLGVGRIENAAPALAVPATVTITLPDVAPAGTGTTMDVEFQLPGDAFVPLNVTVLVPCEAPKLAPVTVTDVPTAPADGDKFVIVGTTVKADPLLFTPLAFTTTFPVVAPAGKGARIEPLFQDVMVEATVPLNNNVPVPCAVPKFDPPIVTGVPALPEAGDTPVIIGAATTVKGELLLGTELIATATLPVPAPAGTVATIDVGLQLPIEVAAVPLNFTVLVPCVDPKFVPVIVTDAPTAPVVRDKLVMLGVRVNIDPLLSTPLVCTVTFPVVAPAGTKALISDDAQVLIVALVPLNATVPEPCVLI